MTTQPSSNLDTGRHDVCPDARRPRLAVFQGLSHPRPRSPSAPARRGLDTLFSGILSVLEGDARRCRIGRQRCRYTLREHGRQARQHLELAR